MGQRQAELDHRSGAVLVERVRRPDVPHRRSPQYGLAHRRDQPAESGDLCRRERAGHQSAVRPADAHQRPAEAAHQLPPAVLIASRRPRHRGTETMNHSSGDRHTGIQGGRRPRLRVSAVRAGRAVHVRLLSAMLALGLLATMTGRAQQQPAQPVFRSSTRLIVQTVSVTDRDGKPVEGLTANDFVVTEDGERQDVAFVEYQRLDGPGTPPADVNLAAAAAPQAPSNPATPAAAPAPPAAAPAPAAPAAAAQSDVPSPVQAGFGARTPGDERFRNRRLLVLYFDLSATSPPDQMRAYDAALKYVDSQMQPADMLAIMTFGGGAVRIKQDFTDNRATLREVIYLLVYGKDEDGDGVRDPEIEGTEFGQNDAEFNVFSTDRQLAALQTAVTMLRPFPEQKSLIYFASNLRLNGTDNNAQLRATTNAAIRANVQLYPVDARGLVATPPLGDATQRSPGGVGMFSGVLAQAANSRFQRSQDKLYALAKDTGGTALFD